MSGKTETATQLCRFCLTQNIKDRSSPAEM